MSARNKIGQMFVDRYGKTSSKRVMGVVACLVGYSLAYIQFFTSCDRDYTTLILGVLAFGKGLIASSLGEKKIAAEKSK